MTVFCLPLVSNRQKTMKFNKAKKKVRVHDMTLKHARYYVRCALGIVYSRSHAWTPRAWLAMTE